MPSTPPIIGKLEDLAVRFVIIAVLFGVSALIIVYSIQALVGTIGQLSSGIAIGIIVGGVLVHFCHTGFAPVIGAYHWIRTHF
jgi:divalent metal cation (Fe/Co/Zn/Cd) transporter